MSEKMSEIIIQANEAAFLLSEPRGIFAMIPRRSVAELEEATTKFLQAAKEQASEGELLSSIEGQIDEMAESYQSLSLSEQEPAFRCVSNYKACKAEAQSLEDKVLCGIAPVICFTKEIIPLA